MQRRQAPASDSPARLHSVGMKMTCLAGDFEDGLIFAGADLVPSMVRVLTAGAGLIG